MTFMKMVKRYQIYIKVICDAIFICIYWWCVWRTFALWLSIFNEGSLPIGTLIANLTGAFLMGLIGTLAISLFQRYPLIKRQLPLVS